MPTCYQHTQHTTSRQTKPPKFFLYQLKAQGFLKVLRNQLTGFCHGFDNSIFTFKFKLASAKVGH